MLNVYIADLANDFVEIDNKSIPIGIGYVGAYCKEKFKDNLNVLPFRTLAPLLKEMELAPPDIIGFGCYDWNYHLSRKVATLIKNKFPDCITVFGGACIDADPLDNMTFLVENQHIDFLVFGDGEFPFSVIVEQLLNLGASANKKKEISYMRIPGVRTLDKGEIVMGQPTDLVDDLGVLPSPYLTGFFDELLQSSLLMPILQNVRGCPYQCCFCVSGSQPPKLRRFPLERVCAEIDYLRENAKHRILRFSDDNFGILPEDMQVAEYIVKSNNLYDYPTGIKIYLSKKLNKRSLKISNTLKKLTLMNISFQSVSPEVLNNIKRPHIPVDRVAENLEFARKNGIATGSELIFGLPGESVASFRETVDKIIELRFDSIALGELWLLKGTKLGSQTMRDQYGYKGMFMLGENAITNIDGLFSIECNEIAVASNNYTFEEWKDFIQLRFLFEFVICFGYARELLFHALSYGIKATDFFKEILDNPELYPTINAASLKYRNKYIENLFETEKELIDYVKRNMDTWSRNKESVVFLSKVRMMWELFSELLFNPLGSSVVLDDFVNAIVNIYKGDDPESFRHLTNHIEDLSNGLIINPLAEYMESKSFKSDYDLMVWIEDGYNKPLSDYFINGGKTFNLRLRNPSLIKCLKEKDIAEGKMNCFNFFRYTNNSQRRRVILQY